MKHLFTLFSVLALFLACNPPQPGSTNQGQSPEGMPNMVIEGVPEVPKELKARMSQYRNTRSAGFQDWHPSGQGMLISTRFGNTNQFHLVEKPEGARQQLTFFEEPVYGADFCPDPSRNGFKFSRDIGGNEYYQLFFQDLNTGTTTMLSDGTSRNQGFHWANKGDRYAYSSTKRNEKDYDIYVASIDNHKSEELVFEGNGYWNTVEWSPDDTKLLIGNYTSINKSHLYILDIKSKALTPISNPEETSYNGSGTWAKDGKGIYLVTDRNGEFNQLAYYDIATQKTEILSEEIKWNTSGLEVSPDGKTLAFIVNEDGISSLHLMNTATNTYKKAAGIPAGLIGGLSFHDDSKQLAFVLNSSQTPSDVYVLNIVSNDLTRWTRSETGGLNADNFVMPELIRFPTFDQVDGQARTIPAFVYRPKNTSGPTPVLISIHGGPEGQFRPGFRSDYQYFVNEMGITVIAPNVRGSAGYGKSYLLLDNGMKREESVQDIGALLDWIETQEDLDKNRIGVIGGSYGGYMSLASMTNYNDRLKCGIDIVGISNFVTFLENTKSYRRDLRRVEYGDERDAAMREHLINISPTTNAEKITKPLFIVQGLNDPRVPASEAEQILDIVKENGTPVWYMLAKDEGHGFRKKRNRDYYTYSVAMFLEEFL